MQALMDAFPEIDAFELTGKGLKLELDIVDTNRAFSALPTTTQRPWRELRDLMKETVSPVLADRFGTELRAHYTWLLGDSLASEVLEPGLVTTDGRLMGRGLGYRLEPHLDSAHMGVTCLLYFATAGDASQGALCLYRPQAVPAVLDASTYYPAKQEGIPAVVEREVAVRPNRFVAFANSPVSLHGFSRPAPAADAPPWRFVYQCHLLPRDFNITHLAPRLSDAHRKRWERLLSR